MDCGEKGALVVRRKNGPLDALACPIGVISVPQVGSRQIHSLYQAIQSTAPNWLVLCVAHVEKESELLQEWLEQSGYLLNR